MHVPRRNSLFNYVAWNQQFLAKSADVECV